MDADMLRDLRTLKAFLVIEAEDYVKFVNGQQARRTAEYKARGDESADYRGITIDQTKYWPFIQIVERVITAEH